MKNVPIKLNGKKRTLRYDFNAIAAVEDRLGVSLANLDEIEESAKTIRALLWAGLLHEDRELDEWQVGSWIDGDNLAEVGDAVTRALALAFGEAEGKVKAGQARRGTGKSSKS